MMLSCIIRVTQHDHEGPHKREEVSHRAGAKQTWSVARKEIRPESPEEPAC